MRGEGWGVELCEGKGGGWWGKHTDNRLRLSRRCRGITVTVSISQRNATSVGVRPDGRGRAMVEGCNLEVLVLVEAGRDMECGRRVRNLAGGQWWQ